MSLQSVKIAKLHGVKAFDAGLFDQLVYKLN